MCTYIIYKIHTYLSGEAVKGVVIDDLFSFSSFLSGVSTSCTILSLDILVIFSVLIRLKLIVGFVIVCPLTIGFTTPLAGDFGDIFFDDSFPTKY